MFFGLVRKKIVKVYIEFIGILDNFLFYDELTFRLYAPVPQISVPKKIF